MDSNDNLSLNAGLLENTKKDSKPPSSFLVLLWRYLTLNIVIERVYEQSKNEGLNNLFNTIALVSALLTGVFMGPFLDAATSKEWPLSSSLTTLQDFAALCLMGCLGSNIGSVLTILFCFTHMNGLPDGAKTREIQELPIFGIPLFLLCISILLLFGWVTCFSFLNMPEIYGWIVLSLGILVLLFSVPIVIYSTFVRLPRIRRAL